LRVQVVRYGNEDASFGRCVSSILASIQLARKQIPSLNLTALLIGDGGGPEGPEHTWERQSLKGFQGRAEEMGVAFSYLEFKENTGHGRGHNILASSETGPSQDEIIVFANPDTYLAPSSLAKLVEALQDKDVAIAEARQIPLEHPKVFDLATGDTPWASGCLMAMKRDAFEKAAGFDEAFFLQGDDVDLSWKIRMLGWRIRHVASAAVFHDKHPGPNGDPIPGPEEPYHSLLARLLLATKAERQDVIEDFANRADQNGSDLEKKALSTFRDLRSSGRLPPTYRESLGVSQLVIKQVATFHGGDYAKRRF
jgi:hypothetical protein